MGVHEGMDSRYHLLCETMMDAFGAVDLTGRICEANQAFLDLVGYTTSVIVHHGALDKDVQFIAKPFQIGKLAWKVRKALDAA
jgi:PAS domain S-box-containing protein